MTVKELMKILDKVKDKSIDVEITVDNNDGCETCGWGGN